MTENVKPVRKLVNGSPGLLDSLVVDDLYGDCARRCVAFDESDGTPRQWSRCALADVLATSSFQLVELDLPPVAVNVKVGGKTSPPGTTDPGTTPGSVLWHGVELDDLSALIETVAARTEEQVIPLFASKNLKEGVPLRSAVAAAAGLPAALKVREHQYLLAFALTDFKLQGRTLPKLILSLSVRKKPPYMDISSFYVFISRVRHAESLRLLRSDCEALEKVSKMKHDKFLRCWEIGYNADGVWSDDRAAKAWRSLAATEKSEQEARKAAAKEDGKKKREEQVRKKRQAAAEARRAVPTAAAKRQAVPVATAAGSRQVPPTLPPAPSPPPPSPPAADLVMTCADCDESEDVGCGCHPFGDCAAPFGDCPAPPRPQALRLHLRGGGNTSAEDDRAAAVRFRNADTLARRNQLPGDPFIVFDEPSHKYTCWGEQVARSVTGLIASFFEGFDPEAITDAYLERWKCDSSSAYHDQIRRTLAAGGSDADAAARIRDEWAERGAEASRKGTDLHRYCEFVFNETPIAIPPGLEREATQFHEWLRSDVVCEHELSPVRTELSVAWRARGCVVTAGQIDALMTCKHGYHYLIDFKRTKKDLDAGACAFGRHGSGPLKDVPDMPLFRYSLQQSLYALMVEQTHGIACDGGMYLLKMHAEVASYEVVQCRDMRREAAALLEFEIARLLAERDAAAAGLC